MPTPDSIHLPRPGPVTGLAELLELAVDAVRTVQERRLPGGWFVRPDPYGTWEWGHDEAVYGDEVATVADALGAIAEDLAGHGACPQCLAETGRRQRLYLTERHGIVCPVNECRWAPGDPVAWPEPAPSPTHPTSNPTGD